MGTDLIAGEFDKAATLPIIKALQGRPEELE